ncbi:MAG: hypothetical protein JST73_11815 [Actinobacteria bacterium]|nr:hypothetical protein [Actinomycetota bacterium]
MRRIIATVVVLATLYAGAGVTAAAPTTDSTSIRTAAIAWLAPQVTAEGALISPYTSAPDPSLTAQALLGLAASGSEPATVTRMVAWLETQVQAFVAPGHAADSPGALAWLILDAEATGVDPTDFGGVDLVTRLEATQRSNGLFGAADPTYDGSFRQGLSLIALSSVGHHDTAGLAWLESQQCTGGAYVAYRADLSIPCPAVDVSTFTGPDTNSTAMAAMALSLGGAASPAAAAMTWLQSVRTPAGGFPYLGDPTIAEDANSTGLVALAFRTVDGSTDAGSVAALASLQVPATGPVADRGGIAFQPQGGSLVPDLSATAQALMGLAGQAFPFRPAAPPTTSTTSTTMPGSTTSTTTPSTTPSTTPPPPVATPVRAVPTFTG